MFTDEQTVMWTDGRVKVVSLYAIKAYVEMEVKRHVFLIQTPGS